MVPLGIRVGAAHVAAGKEGKGEERGIRDTPWEDSGRQRAWPLARRARNARKKRQGARCRVPQIASDQKSPQIRSNQIEPDQIRLDRPRAPQIAHTATSPAASPDSRQPPPPAASTRTPAPPWPSSGAPMGSSCTGSQRRTRPSSPPVYSRPSEPMTAAWMRAPSWAAERLTTRFSVSTSQPYRMCV